MAYEDDGLTPSASGAPMMPIVGQQFLPRGRRPGQPPMQQAMPVMGGQPSAPPAGTGPAPAPALAQPAQPGQPMQPAQPVQQPQDVRPADDGGGLLPAGLAPQQSPTDAMAPVMSGMKPMYSDPLQRAEWNSRRLQDMGPRPATLDDLKNNPQGPQAHHGFRKFMDVLGSTAIGAYTMNPIAGMNVYRHMSEGPLRKGQAKFDAQQAPFREQYEREMGMAKEHNSEEKTAGQIDKFQAEADRANAQATRYSEGIDPNSYYQDPDGNWKARTFSGKTVDATPRAAQKPSILETEGDKRKAREATADAVGLKRGSPDWQHYVATGSFREPNNGRAPTDLEVWLTAFKKEHGREPNAEEIAQRKARNTAASTFKDTAGVDKYSDDWYKGRRSQVDQEKAKARAAYGDDEAGLQKEYARIENDYQGQATEFEGRKKGYYDTVKGGKSVNLDEKGQTIPDENPAAPAAAAAPAKPSGQVLKTASGKQVEVGKPVTVNGQKMIVTGVGKNGKVKVRPANQGE